MSRIKSAIWTFLVLCLTASAQPIAPTRSVPHHNINAPQPSVFVNFSLVRKILCGTHDEDNWGFGTGIVITRNIMMTADHVVRNTETCWDQASKTKVRVIYRDPLNDFALIETQEIEFNHWFTIGCQGFKFGKEYAALGYREGVDLVETHVVATGEFTPEGTMTRDGTAVPHMQILLGDIYQGMSGGPIVDHRGVVVGINSATTGTGVGLSRELRDTLVCNPNHLQKR